MTKTLHDYIREYQDGKDILHDLIGYNYFESNIEEEEQEEYIEDFEHKVSKEIKREDDNYFNPSTLRFSDKKLNYFLSEFKDKYYMVESADIEAWFLSCLFGDKEGQGILSQADLSYSPQQLISWVYKRLSGHMENMREEESMFSESVLSESIDSDYDWDNSLDDSSYSLYEIHSHNNWEELGDFSLAYDSFLDKIGGLKEILSSRQFEVYHMLYVQEATQESVAEQLGISQQSVSDTMKRAENKLKSEYMTFRTYEVLAKDGMSTYKKIVSFLEDYETISEFDSDGSFDYFGFVINWINKTYISESTVESFKDYQAIHKNTFEITTTPFEILVDGLRANEQELFRRVLDTYILKDKTTTNISFMKREKDRFVTSTLRIFNEYDKHIKESVADINEKLVNKIGIKDENFQEVGNIFIN